VSAAWSNYGDAPEMLKYRELYVNDLHKKYNSSVKVNVPVFNNIALTKINMVAIKPRMPYPTIVFNFPTIISSEKHGLWRKKRISFYNTHSKVINKLSMHKHHNMKGN
jgi:hypothetical protein